jgi:hypothetical protein
MPMFPVSLQAALWLCSGFKPSWLRVYPHAARCPRAPVPFPLNKSFRTRELCLACNVPTEVLLGEQSCDAGPSSPLDSPARPLRAAGAKAPGGSSPSTKPGPSKRCAAGSSPKIRIPAPSKPGSPISSTSSSWASINLYRKPTVTVSRKSIARALISPARSL